MTEDEIKKILYQLEEHEKRIRLLEGHTVPSKVTVEAVQSDDKDSNEIVLSIVNKIGECDESNAIQEKVLDRSSVEGKILLCFYISYKYFKNEWLGSGDIQNITSDLGIKSIGG